MARAAERFIYRVTGDRTLRFPTLGITAAPGDTFETDHELVDDGNFVRVNDPSNEKTSEKTPARPAEEA